MEMNSAVQSIGEDIVECLHKHFKAHAGRTNILGRHSQVQQSPCTHAYCFRRSNYPKQWRISDLCSGILRMMRRQLASGQSSRDEPVLNRPTFLCFTNNSIILPSADVTESFAA